MTSGYEFNDNEKALSCKLESLFKYYGLQINKYNAKVSCPFKSHKNGMERTASFMYYPETNTYWCFGCKQGSSVVDFVMNYENCSFNNAVEKILNYENLKFSNIKQNTNTEYRDEALDLKIKFADMLRMNPDEEIMKTYDALLEKHNLDDESMIYVLNKLIKKMEG